jgi:hypothetical protein
MRNVYIFFTIILSVTTLNAQVTANFTTADGYADGALDVDSRWGGQFFSVNTTDEKVSTASNGAEGFWGEKLTSISGSEVTFEVNLNFNGAFSHNSNTLMAQIGFNAGGTTSAGGSDRDWIYLTYNSFNGFIKITNRNNVDFAITTKALDNWIGNNLTVKVSLAIGSSAAESVVSARLINNTTAESTDIGSYGNGTGPSVNTAVFNAAAAGNVYGFFRSVTLQDGDGTTTEFMGVSSVSLTNGSTLSTKDIFLPEFMLSNNPVGETVEISGVEAGSEINIYTITGAKASNHVYNGSSLNLSHLNTGVYFMETPGFAVKKMLKK